MDEKIYLVGNKYGLVGWSNDKETAKKMVKQRKGYSMCKLKERCNINTSSTEMGQIELLDYYPYVITLEEETYFNESFFQYVSDSQAFLQLFFEAMTDLKFTDEEVEILRPLMGLLVDINDGLLLASESGETDAEDLYLPYDIHRVLAHYLDKVMGYELNEKWNV